MNNGTKIGEQRKLIEFSRGFFTSIPPTQAAMARTARVGTVTRSHDLKLQTHMPALVGQMSG